MLLQIGSNTIECDVVSINTSERQTLRQGGWTDLGGVVSMELLPMDADDRSNNPTNNPANGPANGQSEAGKQRRAFDAAVHRRITVAVSWAMARAATLDCQEHFEESFALNEEFREWLLCVEEHPELLDATVLMVPRNLGDRVQPESDGLLEI